MILEDERLDNLSKKYKIIQKKDYYSLSTDSYLLYDFANVKKSKNNRIIELCSGNGAVSILLRQKTLAQITMLEIQEDLVELSKKNLVYNQIEDIEVIHGDIKAINNILKPSSFDNIICNPPYFPVTNMPNLKEKNNHAISRHEILCNLDDVFKAIRYLIKQNGKFFLVHRTYRLADIISTATKNGLGIKKIRFVYSKPDSETSKIILVEGSLSKVSDIKIEQPFYIYNKDNSYTEEMRKIYEI